MKATGKTRWSGAIAFLAAGTLVVLASGCGGEDFENKPRPPVPIELTGVIQPEKVTVSPNRVGAGPVLITISNQTKEAHTVTLEGDTIEERIGPVQPQDTATIQKTLPRGEYEVRAGSSVAVPKEIRPAALTITTEREDSNNRLLLP
jgi:hypothetical protein